jgi:hypothetical protein
MKYTAKQLDECALADLAADAAHTEAQAISGPFYPERGITAESLHAYAAQCRVKIAAYASGGAHEGALQ